MKKGYSTYLRPISIIIDLLIINLTTFVISKELYLSTSYFLYVNFAWLTIAFYIKFYEVYRYTKLSKVASLLSVQLGVFFLAYFAYFSLFKEGIRVGNQSKTILFIFCGIIIFKFLFIYALKKYRVGGGNYRDVIILGGNQSIESLKKLFDTRNNLGYRYKGFFSDSITNKDRYLGGIDESFDFIQKNNVDQIFCSISELSKEQINNVIDFGEKNHIDVKLIPNSEGLFSKGMVLDYYDYIPILSLKKLPFDNPVIKYSKRVFDIVFSLIIIVFVLSWLTPILFILIKTETKGPLFFSQLRDGLNGKYFKCYKYRSMGVNTQADKLQATRGDQRVTRIGKFIRRTSIDELPQFINVFIGDMSVVGPRPHMTTQSKKYAKIVDKYFVRNLVKPGITGLSQVRGLRGEIEEISDMENRVRLDIFYIKNWSFFLDLKIILQTLLNALRGEEKAY